MGRHAIDVATPPHGLALVARPGRRPTMTRRELAAQYLASLTTGASVAALLAFLEVLT